LVKGRENKTDNLSRDYKAPVVIRSLDEYRIVLNYGLLKRMCDTVHS